MTRPETLSSREVLAVRFAEVMKRMPGGIGMRGETQEGSKKFLRFGFSKEHTPTARFLIIPTLDINNSANAFNSFEIVVKEAVTYALENMNRHRQPYNARENIFIPGAFPSKLLSRYLKRHPSKTPTIVWFAPQETNQLRSAITTGNKYGDGVGNISFYHATTEEASDIPAKSVRTMTIEPNAIKEAEEAILVARKKDGTFLPSSVGGILHRGRLFSIAVDELANTLTPRIVENLITQMEQQI